MMKRAPIHAHVMVQLPACACTMADFRDQSARSGDVPGFTACTHRDLVRGLLDPLTHGHVDTIRQGGFV